MGLLLIMFILLAAVGVIAQAMLYGKRFGDHWSVLLLNIAFGTVVSYISYTSFPDNEVSKKVIALTLGLCAVSGLVIGVMSKGRKIISKIFLSISVIGGLLYLFLS